MPSTYGREVWADAKIVFENHLQKINNIYEREVIPLGWCHFSFIFITASNDTLCDCCSFLSGAYAGVFFFLLHCVLISRLFHDGAAVHTLTYNRLNFTKKCRPLMWIRRARDKSDRRKQRANDLRIACSWEVQLHFGFKRSSVAWSDAVGVYINIWAGHANCWFFCFL